MSHTPQAGGFQVTPGGMARSAQEIEAELLKLAHLRRRIVPETRFSSTKGMAFEAQIEILRRRLTRDETRKLYYSHSDNVLSAALTASDWLHGGAEAPSACWEHALQDRPVSAALQIKSR